MPFLLRVLVTIVAMQFVAAFARMLSSGRAPRVEAKRPAKPLVDRASAIDVPFTEEA